MNSALGLCYTFNSPKSGRPLLYATSSGKNSGLRLLLNIERDSYWAINIRPTVGLAIIIHDQKSFLSWRTLVPPYSQAFQLFVPFGKERLETRELSSAFVEKIALYYLITCLIILDRQDGFTGE